MGDGADAGYSGCMFRREDRGWTEELAPTTATYSTTHVDGAIEDGQTRWSYNVYHFKNNAAKQYMWALSQCHTMVPRLGIKAQSCPTKYL